MKKIALSVGVFVISAVYALQQNTGSHITVALTPATTAPTTTTTQSSTSTIKSTQPTTVATTQTAPAKQTQTTQPTHTSATTQTTNPAPAPTPAPKPRGQYTDGTYTGSVADAYYGYVQVRATISGGKLTDVTFLQYPNTHSTSVYINQQAMPYLKQEAIQVQSANVSGVTGASATSMGFRQSLATALAQAKA